MIKKHADRGQAPVSQGAHKIRISSSMLIAAWTQRACPQIINPCFQSNRARQQADTRQSRPNGAATVKERTQSFGNSITTGRNSGYSQSNRARSSLFFVAQPFRLWSPRTNSDQRRPGQALCPKAITTLAFVNLSSIAAWTERACPKMQYSRLVTLSGVFTQTRQQADTATLAGQPAP